MPNADITMVCCRRGNVENRIDLYLYSATSFSPMSKKVVGVQPNKLDSLDANDALTRWAFAQ
jgi:hypothetical protein